MTSVENVKIDGKSFQVYLFFQRFVFYFEEKQTKKKLKKIEKICSTIEKDIEAYVSTKSAKIWTLLKKCGSNTIKSSKHCLQIIRLF